MNCLIVDDQLVFREILKRLIDLDLSLTLVGECGDTMAAHHIIRQQEVNVLFLDVEMPGMSGIELAETLAGQRPLVIFTTAVAGYAAEAFDLNVVDYLVKPVTPARFLKAVEKAREILKNNMCLVSSKTDDEFVFIRDSNSIKRLKVVDILYLEASGDYVKIYLADHTHTIHISLKSIEQKLSRNAFFRVHRSFIINLGKIDTIGGSALIINQHRVPVADVYRAALYQRMQIL
jgi:two-component system LytT family response regulator